MALGLSDDAGHPKVDSQVVVGIETQHYYTGLFGLTNQPTGLSNFTVSNPSFLTTLKNQGLIPSLSWAYTAGARYRSKGVFGSLTFGGFDQARYNPNNISFNLAPDVGRDLVVGLQSIKSTYANGSSQSFLPSPILSFIDSTIPYIYLPTEACQVFEREFGLVWNSSTNLYFLSDDTHRELLASNPQFSFTIGNDKTSATTVDISLPYASFDLVFSPPVFPNATSYFPLRRAANESQFTLGRTFLQEAYVFQDVASPRAKSTHLDISLRTTSTATFPSHRVASRTTLHLKLSQSPQMVLILILGATMSLRRQLLVRVSVL